MSEQVEGVTLSKVDKDRLNSVAHSIGIKPNGLKGTVAAVAAKFADYEGDIADCNHCGGAGPADMDACPYCGLANDETVGSDVVQSADLDAAEGNVEEEDDEESESSSESGESESDVVASSAQAKRSSAMLSGGAEVEGKVLSAGEVKLDEAVKRINTCKVGSAVAWYKLGLEIKRVFDSNIWKMRTDENGKPAYKGFNDFVRKELSLSKSTVWGAMKVTEQFTVADVEKYGVNRLELLVMSAPKKQKMLKEFIESGASRAKVREKLKELNAGEKRVGRPQKPQVREREGELTLAAVIGKKHTIPCFLPKKDAKGNHVAAKKLADQPWGWLDLKNGVRMTARVATFPSGQLKLIVEFKREEL